MLREESDKRSDLTRRYEMMPMSITDTWTVSVPVMGASLRGGLGRIWAFLRAYVPY